MRLLFFFIFVPLVFLVSASGRSYFHAGVDEVLQLKEDSVSGRDAIVRKLKNKIAAGEPLIVHVFVPLCDNVHQGIVPVPAALGNGSNPQSNLYWGAAYGVKTWFKKDKGWQWIGSEKVDSVILERIMLHKIFPNGASVYLVADAYRGDRMADCLKHFLGSIAGRKNADIFPEGKKIKIYGGADLLVFNGHNGLMDMSLSGIKDLDADKKDAAVIACASFSYFKNALADAGAFPLITTSHFLAPEAYVLKAIVEAWAMLSQGDHLCQEAAKAYNTYQKCGMKGALGLFKTGW